MSKGAKNNKLDRPRRNPEAKLGSRSKKQASIYMTRKLLSQLAFGTAFLLSLGSSSMKGKELGYYAIKIVRGLKESFGHIFYVQNVTIMKFKC